jgi:hypothetical protein
LRSVSPLVSLARVSAWGAVSQDRCASEAALGGLEGVGVRLVLSVRRVFSGVGRNVLVGRKDLNSDRIVKPDAVPAALWPDYLSSKMTAIAAPNSSMTASVAALTRAM